MWALQVTLLSLHKSMPRGGSEARAPWLPTPSPWADPGTQGLHCVRFLAQNFPKALTQALPPAPAALSTDPQPNPGNKTPGG